jgi:hypothetical protein
LVLAERAGGAMLREGGQKLVLKRRLTPKMTPGNNPETWIHNKNHGESLQIHKNKEITYRKILKTTNRTYILNVGKYLGIVKNKWFSK